jgi:hypothetical protein
VLKVNWISFSFANQSAGRWPGSSNRNSKEQIRLNILKINWISQNFTNQCAGQHEQGSVTGFTLNLACFSIMEVHKKPKVALATEVVDNTVLTVVASFYREPRSRNHRLWWPY